jgi:hypothetical protein
MAGRFVEAVEAGGSRHAAAGEGAAERGGEQRVEERGGSRRWVDWARSLNPWKSAPDLLQEAAQGGESSEEAAAAAAEELRAAGQEVRAEARGQPPRSWWSYLPSWGGDGADASQAEERGVLPLCSATACRLPRRPLV